MRKAKESVTREQVSRLGRPSVEQMDRYCEQLERKAAYLNVARRIALVLLLTAAAAALVLNLWVPVLQADGSSMSPTLLTSEVVLAIKHNSPARGNVVAFYHNNKLYIKRVIAVAGERVDISGDGVVTVNDKELSEPYVSEPSLGGCDIQFPYTVPAGTVFVLGDNRPTALDSRSSQFGAVNRDQLVGKVIFRVWPLKRFGHVR